MTEEQIQKGVVVYLNTIESVTRGFTFTHPNATNIGARIGAKLKRLGQKAGVPDLVLFFDGGTTAFIELKTIKGRLHKSQQDFHGVLKTLGFQVDTIKAKDSNDAIDQIIPILERNGVRVSL